MGSGLEIIQKISNSSSPVEYLKQPYISFYFDTYVWGMMSRKYAYFLQKRNGLRLITLMAMKHFIHISFCNWVANACKWHGDDNWKRTICLPCLCFLVDMSSLCMSGNGEQAKMTKEFSTKRAQKFNTCTCTAEVGLHFISNHQRLSLIFRMSSVKSICQPQTKETVLRNAFN